MDFIEKLFLQHEATFALLGKVFGTMLGVGLFFRFVYNFTVKYFENQGKDIARIKKFIWGPDGEPEKGIEHRLTDLERDHKHRTKENSCGAKK